MASRLPKSSRFALSLTVAVAAMAVGGPALAQRADELNGGKVVLRCEGSTNNCGTPEGGSLRNAPEDEATDPPANNPEPAPAEPPADADEGTATRAPGPASNDDEPGEPE
jgi:hypothetical protein